MAHTDKRPSMKRLRKLWRKMHAARVRYEKIANGVEVSDIEDGYTQSGWTVATTATQRPVVIAPSGIVYIPDQFPRFSSPVDAVNELMKNLDNEGD